MKLKKLFINNFGPISLADICFNDGILFVEGENRDDSMAESNGSGKSSLINAIGWCLTGKTPENKGFDDVIYKGGEKCSVILKIDDINLKRSRGKINGLFISYDNKKFKKTTQEEVDNLFGINKDWFYNSTFLGQDFVSFYDFKPMARKELLSEFLPKDIIDDLNKLNSESKKEIVACEDKLKELNIKIKLYDDGIFLLKEKKEKCEELYDNFESKRTKSIKQLDDKYKINKEKIINDSDNTEKSIHNLQMNIEKSKSYATKIESKIHEKSNVSEEISERYYSIYSEHCLVASKIGEKIESIKSISNLTLGKCPTCFLDVTEKTKEKCLKEINKELDELKLIKEKMIPDVELTKKQFDTAVIEIDKLKKLLDKTKTSILLMEQSKSQFEKESNKLNSDLKNLENNYSEQMAMLNEEVNSYDNEIEFLNSQIDELLIKGKNDNIEIKSIENDLKLLHSIKEMSGNDGVKSLLFDQFMYELEDNTNNYLSCLSSDLSVSFSTQKEHKKGTTSESLDIKVYENGEDGYTLSGGQKQKIRVATSLALADLLNSRSSNKLDFMILDEPHRGLDRAGQSKLFGLFNDIYSSGKKSLIIMTSPQSDFKSLFNKSIRVTKSEGTSYVSKEKE